MGKRWPGLLGVVLSLLLIAAGCSHDSPGMTLEQQLVVKLMEDVEAEEDTGVIPETPEDIILRLFLSSRQSGGYLVVNAETSISCLSIVCTSDAVKWIYFITDWVEDFGYGNTDLAAHFFNENMLPSRLTLKSSLEDGYYIDYDGRFEKCRQQVSKKAYRDGGWAAFTRENFPRFNTFLTMSRPAYDPQTGLALVLVSVKCAGDMAGEGQTILYLLQYKDAKLREIAAQEIRRARPAEIQ